MKIIAIVSFDTMHCPSQIDTQARLHFCRRYITYGKIWLDPTVTNLKVHNLI